MEDRIHARQSHTPYPAVRFAIRDIERLFCTRTRSCERDRSELQRGARYCPADVSGLEPASDMLWDSGGWVLDASGYEELYPTTDDGWAFVRAQAAIVVEAGNMLALPGRAEDDDAWMIYSEGLSEAGIMAMEAAEAQDKEAFFQAGGQLYSVCTACHQSYSPDVASRFDNSAD